MIDFFKFFARKDVQKAVKDKVKEKQDRGFVEKDFESVINGKKIKMILPNDIREQLYISNVAPRWILEEAKNMEESYENDLKYYEFIAKHMLIDGEEIKDINSLNFEDLKAYGMTYYLELLLPLYQRSATKTQEAVKQILKGYLKK